MLPSHTTLLHGKPFLLLEGVDVQDLIDPNVFFLPQCCAQVHEPDLGGVGLPSQAMHRAQVRFRLSEQAPSGNDETPDSATVTDRRRSI